MAKEIKIPQKLQNGISAIQQAYVEQVEKLNAATKRDIELLVSGYVSSLYLPDDVKLQYNHATGTLSYEEGSQEAEIPEE
jgi:hypothetical protein